MVERDAECMSYEGPTHPAERRETRRKAESMKRIARISSSVSTGTSTGFPTTAASAHSETRPSLRRSRYHFQSRVRPSPRQRQPKTCSAGPQQVHAERGEGVSGRTELGVDLNPASHDLRLRARSLERALEDESSLAPQYDVADTG